MLDAKPGHHVHPYTATIGMWLFLAALTMLFGATMMGYGIVRARLADKAQLGTLHLPHLLWLSTALMLGGSVAIHSAVVAVRRERQQRLRQWLIATCALAIGFVAIQTPAMASLLVQHRAFRAQGMHLYALMFFLILIHALHVLGGMIGLAVTTRHAFGGRYDHERYAGVKHAAMYWHFLDVVWLVMFFGMVLTG